MTIGEKIKEVRKDNGMTQRQLASLAEIAEITLSQYERGKRQPKIEQLKKIAGALSVPISSLFEGSDASVGDMVKDDLDMKIFKDDVINDEWGIKLPKIKPEVLDGIGEIFGALEEALDACPSLRKMKSETGFDFLADSTALVDKYGATFFDYMTDSMALIDKYGVNFEELSQFYAALARSGEKIGRRYIDNAPQD